MALTLDMLAAFVKVADSLSLSAAAAELGVAKSVVSKRIAQLETVLGATLLNRTTRRVALTRAGEVYLVRARQALAAMRHAEEELRTLRTELSGLIRVTAPVSWGQRVMGRLLPQFLALHPGLEAELVLEDRLMDLAQERIDLGLRMTATPSLDLVSLPLARLDWVICAAQSYLDTTSVPKQPEDLAAHPCMAYWRTSRETAWQMSGHGRSATVRVHSRFRANNPEAACYAALSGLGIALLPRYVCEAELAAGQLLPLLPGWTPVTEFGDRITAVALPDRIRFTRVQALLAFLRGRLQPPPGPKGSGRFA